METSDFSPDNSPHNQHETSDVQLASSTKGPVTDPSWDKWRNDQVQTISTILSNVFKVEDEVRQSQSPSRLLRNHAINSQVTEEDIRDKLQLIRQQISEYEQVLQVGLKRIDTALQKIQPAALSTAHPEKNTPLSPASALRRRSVLGRTALKNWVKRFIRIK